MFPKRLHRNTWHGSLLILLAAFTFIFGCGERAPTADEVLAETEALRSSGRIGEAIAQLEDFDRANPGDLRIVESLAFAYLEEGDPATAAMFFARANEIDPSQAEYLLMAAEAWETAGEPDTAISVTEQYLAVRPNDRSVRLSLAETYHHQGNLDAARDRLLQANRNQPDGEVQVRIGALFLEGGNLAQAQSWFDSAARFGDEARDEALLGLLEVVVRADRFEDAENLVSVLDDEFPGRLDESRLAPIRGQLETWRLRQTAAREAAQGVLSSTAEVVAQVSPEAPRTSPRPAVADGSEETAGVGTTAEANRSASGQAPVAEGRSTPLGSPPDKEERVAAMEFTPPSDGPSGTGTRSLFPTGDAAGMVPAQASREYLALVESARTAFAEGRYPAAIKDFQRALARTSDSPEIWSELSEAQYRFGNFDAAPASAGEAVRRAPNNPRFRLQHLRVQEGSTPTALLIRDIEQAKRDFPQNPEFSLVLARAHEDLGNERFARRYFEEFLRLAPPGHPERAQVEQALSRL